MLSPYRYKSDAVSPETSGKPLRVAFSESGYNFVDSETPAGVIDGANDEFTLTQAPNPAASLQLFKNGILQTEGTDYDLVSDTITYVAGAIPQVGDAHVAFFRY